jgi:hypothetical protein
MHMVIPEGCKTKEYKNFYRDIGLSPDVTIMLDNGAYEEANKESLRADRLVRLIYEFRADIFVLPDAMRDGGRTIALARDFLHYWDMYHIEYLPKPVQFMGVVQGHDLHSMRKCITSYEELEEQFEMSLVLGLSKWMTQEKGSGSRMMLATLIEEHFPHSIHLLGMSKAWPKEILYAAQACPNINSVDATAPFTYAMSGLKLGVDEAPGRPANYFGADTKSVDEELLQANLETLWSWADGREA